MENKVRNIVWTLYANSCRMLLAIVFVFSGFVKANDPMGFQYKLGDYAIAFGLTEFVSESLLLAASIAMAALEFMLGIYLFLGINRRLSSTLAVLLMLLMTPLTCYIALENPVSDCGCFGDALVLSNWQTFWKNVILLIAAVSLFLLKGRVIRFVSYRSEWMVSVYMMLYIFVFSYYTLHHLPVFDFRPYRVGSDIPAGMEIPEGELPPQYETIFVMERGGEQREFTIDNYPDTTWTFVERRTVLKHAGYEPPIHDLALVSIADGEDITDKVLSDTSYTFLLVAYDLENADDGYSDLINEVYEYSLEGHYSFYALTASDKEETIKWLDRTGGEYSFCNVDEITLKTMIRSNPGLILLKDGVVVNKWANDDIPNEYQLVAPLEDLPLAQVQVDGFVYKMLKCFMWLLAPLLFILMLDRISNHRLLNRNKELNTINPLINKEEK